MNLGERLKKTIRDIPDFPKPGILFKDITPILEDASLSADIVDFFADHFSKLGVDAVVGVESRGFLFGMPIAIKMGKPFITVRKKGKLPYKTINYKYDLEYGSAEVEMHVDSIKPGWKVVIHDDLLATGGTASAAAELVKMQHADVFAFAFLVELGFLNGKEKLNKYTNNIINLVSY
ncbi:MAG: adenine phosphoribosyltransferase [Bacteroidota bacterium]